MKVVPTSRLVLQLANIVHWQGINMHQCILLAWQDNLKRWVHGTDTDNITVTAKTPFGIMTGLQIGLCVVCFLAGTGYCSLLQNIWTGPCDYSDPCSRVQILQQALILTPTHSDKQLWTSKKVCEMAYNVSCESAEHIWSYDSAQNFLSFFFSLFIPAVFKKHLSVILMYINSQNTAV